MPSFGAQLALKTKILPAVAVSSATMCEDRLLVSRIMATEYVGVELFFFTRGDGENPQSTWPNTPQVYEYDQWNRVSEDMVEGKVVARIPWIGSAGVWLNNALGVEGYYMIVPVTLILLWLFLFIKFSASLIG